jgi:hypothetical protein
MGWEALRGDGSTKCLEWAVMLRLNRCAKPAEMKPVKMIQSLYIVELKFPLLETQ